MTVGDFDVHLWHHRARVVSVLDADTLTGRPELGYVRDLGMTVAYRLRGVYAPELPKGDRGAVVAAQPDHPGVRAYVFVDALLRADTSPDGWKPLRVRTYEKERATVNVGGFVKSFDRWICDCWAVEADGTLTSLAAAIIAAGHASPVPS